MVIDIRSIPHQSGAHTTELLAQVNHLKYLSNMDFLKFIFNITIKTSCQYYKDKHLCVELGWCKTYYFESIYRVLL